MKITKGLLIAGLCLALCSVDANAQSKQVPQIEPLLKGGNPRVVQKPLLFGNVKVDNIKRKFLNVPYGHISKTQYVDIYLPDKKSTKPYPVIVAIHGGAFFMGDAKMENDITPMLAGLKRGYAVVSVNYRLSGEATFPRAVNDVKAAVRFVRANAKKYNFDPQEGDCVGRQRRRQHGADAGHDRLRGQPERRQHRKSAILIQGAGRGRLVRAVRLPQVRRAVRGFRLPGAQQLHR
jgi:hypothetical protein